jgi:pyruvate/2-oxoglutarate dehydrogenase complex dihydrolipoamide acyltransferase (E2) component
MISKAIGNILISNQGLVNAAEAKIKEAGKNKVQEEVLSKLPNPADLQNQLNGINVQNTEQLKKAEQTYKKLHNVCEVSISKLNSFKTQIKAIDKKLEIVNQLFNKAKEVIELVQPIIPILKFTIPVIANALLAKLIF